MTEEEKTKAMLELMQAVAEQMKTVEEELETKEVRATIATMVAMAAMVAMEKGMEIQKITDAIKDIVKKAIMAAKNVDLKASVRTVAGWELGSTDSLLAAIKTIKAMIGVDGPEQDFKIMVNTVAILVGFYKSLNK